MNLLKDVTSYFRSEHIHDVGIAAGWIAAAAGEKGLCLIQIRDGAFAHLSSEESLDSPILVTEKNIFFKSSRGAPSPDTSKLIVASFFKNEEDGLSGVHTPHFCFATAKNLYGLHGGGDLKRTHIRTGETEFPSSPFGVYRCGDHAVQGTAIARRGAVVLSRYAGRAESLVDALPDHPSRPIARAAVLPDRDFGEKLSGPAVAARWAYVLCHEKGCLLSLHLHNPEVRQESPIPDGLASQEEILLAAGESGQVFAASSRGIDLLIGHGAPDHFAFPGGRTCRPARLLVEKSFALLTTGEGRLFMAE